MTADIYRDGFHYHLDFKKGENVGGLQKEPFKGKRTGSVIRWLPDTRGFHRHHRPGRILPGHAQAAGGGQRRRYAGLAADRVTAGDADKLEFLYENGIADYVNELAGDDALTPVRVLLRCRGAGRDRADQPDYQVKMSVAFCVLQHACSCLEYYHNSSWLEHGGSPDRAVAHRICQPDRRLSEKQGPVQKEREQDHLCRRAGLPCAMSRPASPPAPATRTRPKRPSRTSSWPRP